MNVGTAAAPGLSPASCLPPAAASHPVLTWERRDHGAVEFLSRLPSVPQQVWQDVLSCGPCLLPAAPAGLVSCWWI